MDRKGERGRMRRSKEDDEVEQLLQSAQDEMLLKLSVDSHTSRSKPDYLDPDLHSRFLALRSKPSAKNKEHKQRPRSPLKKSKDVEETSDDLMLRFSALKTTLPSSSTSSSVSQSVSRRDEIGEDAEVEKLIQWAVDAARLDPSPSSDDDDDNDSQNSDNDDDDDDYGTSKRNVKP